MPVCAVAVLHAVVVHVGEVVGAALVDGRVVAADVELVTQPATRVPRPVLQHRARVLAWNSKQPYWNLATKFVCFFRFFLVAVVVVVLLFLWVFVIVVVLLGVVFCVVVVVLWVFVVFCCCCCIVGCCFLCSCCCCFPHIRVTQNTRMFVLISVWRVIHYHLLCVISFQLTWERDVASW